MAKKIVRSPGLFLAGFMGCGKTTVGRLLGQEMGWSFIDLDDVIEAEEGMPISEIFLHRGEAEFRRLEHEALARQVHEITFGHPRIIALGGGAFSSEENRTLLRDHCVTVWLDAPLDLIRKRIAGQSHRPLAQDAEQFTGLYESRRASYALADYRVEVSADDPKITVERIQALPLW